LLADLPKGREHRGAQRSAWERQRRGTEELLGQIARPRMVCARAGGRQVASLCPCALARLQPKAERDERGGTNKRKRKDRSGAPCARVQVHVSHLFHPAGSSFPLGIPCCCRLPATWCPVAFPLPTAVMEEERMCDSRSAHARAEETVALMDQYAQRIQSRARAPSTLCRKKKSPACTRTLRKLTRLRLCSSNDGISWSTMGSAGTCRCLFEHSC
jgi:hypothetical protein